MLLGRPQRLVLGDECFDQRQIFFAIFPGQHRVFTSSYLIPDPFGSCPSLTKSSTSK
jgi:hypothetical protein